MKQWDVILAGGGLANGLIALRLRQQQPSLRLLMVEAGPSAGGNHTWSFHEDDLTAEQHHWIAPLVAHRWQGYDVRFPRFTRTLTSDYLSITSERFAEAIGELLGEDLLTGCEISALTPHSVRLADGRTFTAGAVIDGRGYRPSRYHTIGLQAFLGQQWQLAQPHGLQRPILMDATVDQQQSYRFVYTLPLSADTLLIEDTHYQDSVALEPDAARQRIADYAAAQGWQLQTLQREERGSLPITLAGQPAAFRAQHQLPCSGLRAGLFHPTTGYSLPLAASLADLIARQPTPTSASLNAAIGHFSARQWRQQRFFRVLNRMLFLAGPPAQRWQIMQRFYSLDDRLIARFYAGHPTLTDRIRILTRKPPVPVGKALLAVLKKTSRLRAFR